MKISDIDELQDHIQKVLEGAWYEEAFDVLRDKFPDLLSMIGSLKKENLQLKGRCGNYKKAKEDVFPARLYTLLKNIPRVTRLYVRV